MNLRRLLRAFLHPLGLLLFPVLFGGAVVFGEEPAALSAADRLLVERLEVIWRPLFCGLDHHAGNRGECSDAGAGARAPACAAVSATFRRELTDLVRSMKPGPSTLRERLQLLADRGYPTRTEFPAELLRAEARAVLVLWHHHLAPVDGAARNLATQVDRGNVAIRLAQLSKLLEAPHDARRWYGHALEIFAALEAQPYSQVADGYSEAATGLALLLEEAGDLEGARYQLQTNVVLQRRWANALDGNPGRSVEALRHLGFFFWNQADLTAARGCLEEALGLQQRGQSPGAAVGWYLYRLESLHWNFAHLLLDLKDPRAAKAHFERAVEVGDRSLAEGFETRKAVLPNRARFAAALLRYGSERLDAEALRDAFEIQLELAAERTWQWLSELPHPLPPEHRHGLAAEFHAVSGDP